MNVAVCADLTEIGRGASGSVYRPREVARGVPDGRLVRMAPSLGGEAEDGV